MNQAHVDDKTIGMVAVDNLHFDPHNPRLPSNANGNGEETVLQWMLKDASIIELMGSIGEYNYFNGEPLLVSPNGEHTYMVIEGNRRLAAVKLLLAPELAPKRRQASTTQASKEAKFRPTEVPCVIYKNREEIQSYLGYRHITGIKPWGSLEKAKYLKQLYPHTTSKKPQEKFRELAKMIGSRADYVARLLTGLALYDTIAEKDFFAISGLDEESISFSLITTAMNYTNIVGFLELKSATDDRLDGLSIKNLTLLTKWIFEKNTENVTRLGESRNLKLLNTVVANEKACKAFIAGKALTEAVLLTEEPLVAFRTAITYARTSLETARDTIHLVENPASSDTDILQEVLKLTRVLLKVTQGRLLEEEEV